LQITVRFPQMDPGRQHDIFWSIEYRLPLLETAAALCSKQTALNICKLGGNTTLYFKLQRLTNTKQDGFRQCFASTLVGAPM